MRPRRPFAATVSNARTCRPLRNDRATEEPPSAPPGVREAPEDRPRPRPCGPARLESAGLGGRGGSCRVTAREGGAAGSARSLLAISTPCVRGPRSWSTRVSARDSGSRFSMRSRQGAAVVTSAGTATAEVAGDAALLVDPVEVDAIAEAIERVLGDPGFAATLREKGRRRAATFTWDRSAAIAAEVYEEAARPR